MGDVYVSITIANPRNGAPSEKISALADTGATLTILPRPLLERLGIQKTGSVTFELADGRRVRHHVGNAVIAIGDDITACRVVFGRPNDAPLLGITVLEQVGLAVDPVRRRLVPASFRL